MIRYTLTCDQDHNFDSWFQSSGAFDALSNAGHLSCAVCGSKTVQRALMAPSVSANTKQDDRPDLHRPTSDAEAALAKMRAHVEKNSDYVGSSFVSEARRMHDGDAPGRSIWGEAKLDEAKKLIEDGIPVAPLPFLPKRKAN